MIEVGRIISNVRVLYGVIIALVGAVATATGVAVGATDTSASMRGHERIMVRVDSVQSAVRGIVSDVVSMQAWRDSASAVQTALMCGEIARNQGIDPRPCEMLCPAQIRRDIRELLRGAQ